MKRTGRWFPASNGVLAIGLVLVIFGLQGMLTTEIGPEILEGMTIAAPMSGSLMTDSGSHQLTILAVQPSPRAAQESFMGSPWSPPPEDSWFDPADQERVVPTPLPAVFAPTRISIPAIQLDAPVELSKTYKVSIQHREFLEWDAPNTFAAGWQEGSAPLGVPGNTVINGHNNENGDVFLYLVKVKVGDQIYLFSSDARFTYEVTNRMLLPEQDQELEIRLANAVWIQPSLDERLTLVTCWPWNGNSHRLVIVARPVEDVDP